VIDVTLVVPDAELLRACARLRVTPSQQAFVAPVDYYLQMCADPGSPWQARAVVANGEVVGFVMRAIDPTDDSYWIGGVIVDAAHQGRGVGHAAISELIGEATVNGHSAVGLTIHPDNPLARALYARLGFVETEERDDDEIVARLPLRLHDDELSIGLPLVRSLVDRALPHLSVLPLTRLRSSGSSNALFRLGDELLVRLPRQPGGSATIEKEARWLPHVAPQLPTSVPEVVVIGEPGFGYPEHWSVVRWLDGDVPSVADPDSADDPSRVGLALGLAGVVTALADLEVPAAAQRDPELRWYRGEPLAEFDATTRQGIEACRAIPDLDLDLDACLAVWGHAMTLPGIAEAVPPRWYHGDLLAENLLVRSGRLSAVLDFGGLAVGDPTVDLIVAWEVLDATAREVFRQAVGVDDPAWLRGRAWALGLSVLTFPYYWRTMPQRCAVRRSMARSVLTDAGLA
jgi:aminoglycoside phosphotransferase (APT) family kinase protein/ribosomal protein S18 acetylase RimI-like enzyme